MRVGCKQRLVLATLSLRWLFKYGIMNSGHRHTLLNACLWTSAERRSDSVRLICLDGECHVSVIMLASLIPWLKEPLLDQVTVGDSDHCVIVKELHVDDWQNFVSALVEPNFTAFMCGEALKSAMANVGQSFSINLFQQMKWDQTSTESADVEEEQVVPAAVLEPAKRQPGHLCHLSDEQIRSYFSDQEGRLVCLICYKIYSADGASSFRRHLLSHPKLFRWPDELSETSCKGNRSQSFSCTSCQKSFSRMTLLNQHAFRAHGDTRHFKFTLNCPTCQFQCANASGLTAHLRSHQQKALSCQYCQRQFREQRFLHQHLKSGICREENRKCEMCQKVYSDPTRLKVHMNSFHSERKDWRCEVCQKSFAQKRSLKEHSLTHGTTRQFECQHCRKRFVQRNHLKSHLISRHPEHSRTESAAAAAHHVCKICSRAFAFPFQLRKHESQHVSKQ